MLKSCNRAALCKAPLRFVNCRPDLSWIPPDGVECIGCHKTLQRMNGHLGRSRACAHVYFSSFWHQLTTEWDERSMIDRNTAAVRWWLDLNDGCVCSWLGSSLLNDHLRIRDGDRCLVRMLDLFEEALNRGDRPVLNGMETLWKRG